MDLSVALSHGGHDAESDKLNRDAYYLARRVLGPENPDTLHLMLNEGVVLYWAGRYAEAEKLFRETLDLTRRVQGPEKLNTMRQ